MDALILSGGGALGAYEVGVVQALTEKRGLKAQVFTGTSVGAFNAAILTTQTIGRLEDIWLKDIAQANLASPNGVMRIRGNPLPYLRPPNPADAMTGLVRDSLFLARFTVNRARAFMTSDSNLASRSFELIDLSSFISVAPLMETIGRTVSFAGIRDSKNELRIIATDWATGTPVIFHNKHMTDRLGKERILASTAIPGIFPPVEIEGRIYVDGGVVMNTPLLPAIQADADTLHVISLDPAVRQLPPQETDNTIESLLRTAQIAIGKAVREDMATVQWINAGLDVLDKAATDANLTDRDVRDFVRVASQIAARAQADKGLKRLTVHHYQPASPLGGGLTLLDFRHSTLTRLMERGYADAARHDCKTAGCVLA
jgi:NTE family protein